MSHKKPYRFRDLFDLCQPLFGCVQREAEVAIDQDKALQVIRSQILLEPALFERLEYNPTSEAVVEKWIDPPSGKGLNNAILVTGRVPKVRRLVLQPQFKDQLGEQFLMPRRKSLD